MVLNVIKILIYTLNQRMATYLLVNITIYLFFLARRKFRIRTEITFCLGRILNHLSDYAAFLPFFIRIEKEYKILNSPRYL